MDGINIKPLRDYQRAAVDAVVANLRYNPVLCMPCGSGKTTTASTLIRETGLRTLFLAERKKLVDQAAAELRSHGLDVGVIMAGRPHHPNRHVQVGSIQTVTRRECGKFDLLVPDECHRSLSKTQEKLLTEDYADTPRVGLTATPFRLDRKPLGNLFGKLIIAAYPDELIERGILIEPKVFAPPPASMDGIKIVRGDYEQDKVARAVNKPKLIGDVVQTWIRLANGLRTMFFGCSVEHSKNTISAFNEAGIPAEHVDGGTPDHEREKIFGRLISGETKIVGNVDLATYGFDMPSLECLIVAKPTASLCLHIQIIGRAMRCFPGKREALILDHAGNFLRHGRVTRRLEYSLTEAVKPVDEDLGLVVCDQCQRMVSSKRKTCPECGAILPEPTPSPGLGGKRGLPKTQAGELVSFEDAMAEIERNDKERYFLEMIQVAKEKGYAVGWAAWQVKHKFGSMPETRISESETRVTV